MRGETLEGGRLFGSGQGRGLFGIPPGASLTPGLSAPGSAAALSVLQHSGRLRRLLKLRYEALHVVEHVVQDVLGDRARGRVRPLGPGPSSLGPEPCSQET